ncbi:MAG: zinc ribbon domain-containing protein [Phycisphaerales bacterium]|nr:zinc ribbon domain-containing protein [Phycisphaerales bacterium]
MPMNCSQCHHPNPEQARFCSRCGQGLAPQIPLPPLNMPGSRTPKKQKSSCVWWTFFFCFVALGGLWASKGRLPWSCSLATCDVERNISLDTAKREAMIDLLRPKDVSVIVGRRPHGIFLEGTPQEIRTVERFIQLFEHDHQHDWHGPAKSNDPWSSEMVERTYRLTKSKAKTLAYALSLSDLYVVRPSRKELVIIATNEDHKTISGMVNILGGRCTAPR